MRHHRASAWRLFPTVQIIDEAGLPGWERWCAPFVILGPMGIADPAITRKFNAAIKVALDDPETQKKLAELGNTPRWGDHRAIYGDGEARPRQVGRGRESRRREGRDGGKYCDHIAKGGKSIYGAPLGILDAGKSASRASRVTWATARPGRFPCCSASCAAPVPRISS